MFQKIVFFSIGEILGDGSVLQWWSQRHQLETDFNFNERPIKEIQPLPSYCLQDFIRDVNLALFATDFGIDVVEWKSLDHKKNNYPRFIFFGDIRILKKFDQPLVFHKIVFFSIGEILGDGSLLPWLSQRHQLDTDCNFNERLIKEIQPLPSYCLQDFILDVTSKRCCF